MEKYDLMQRLMLRALLSFQTVYPHMKKARMNRRIGNMSSIHAISAREQTRLQHHEIRAQGLAQSISAEGAGRSALHREHGICQTP